MTKTHNTGVGVYFGHHKCATTWVSGILFEVSRETAKRIANYPHTGQAPLNAWLSERNPDLVLIRNARPSQPLELELPFRALHVIRDPRDVVVSAYFSHRNSHPTDVWPELTRIREQLRQRTQEDGLLFEIDFLERQFQEMYDWDYHRPEILELRMESLIEYPFDTMLRAFRHLELIDDKPFTMPKRIRHIVDRGMRGINNRLLRGHGPRLAFDTVPTERFLGILHEYRFDSLARGRKRGEENVDSHFRKGVAGDWKTYFTARVIDAFHDRWQGLLERLGYEQDSEWTSHSHATADPVRSCE